MQTAWLRGTASALEPGVYETLRWHDGPPPALAHHAARWQRGRAALGLPDLGLTELLAEAQPLLTPGELWRVRLTAWQTGAVELAWRPLTADERTPRPWSLRVVGRVAEPPAHLRACKTTALNAAHRWRTHAGTLGADEALLRGPDGQWAEATTANLLCGLADGRIVTPGPESAALPGTTLARVRTLLPVEDARLDEARLPRVRWALLTNAIALLRPVAAIDGVALRPPPPEILGLAQQLRGVAMLSR